jgi:hypothetical protein
MAPFVAMMAPSSVATMTPWPGSGFIISKCPHLWTLWISVIRSSAKHWRGKTLQKLHNTIEFAVLHAQFLKEPWCNRNEIQESPWTPWK